MDQLVFFKHSQQSFETVNKLMSKPVFCCLHVSVQRIAFVYKLSVNNFFGTLIKYNFNCR